MVIEYFNPSRKWSWKELDELTGKRKGLWTWNLYGLASLQEQGFDVVNWEDLDYKRFSEEGASYLVERFGKRPAAEIIKNSDIKYEMDVARRLMGSLTEPKVPTFQDVAHFLSEGYLVVCNINLNRLNDKRGYAGHFVLVHSLTDEMVTFHDPGPPPVEARKIYRQDFLEAWEHSSERDRNLMAFRPKSLRKTGPSP